MRDGAAELVERPLTEITFDQLVVENEGAIAGLVEDLDDFLDTLEISGLGEIIIDDEIGIDCSSHTLFPYLGSLRYAACPCFSMYSRISTGVISERFF